MQISAGPFRAHSNALGVVNLVDTRKRICLELAISPPAGPERHAGVTITAQRDARRLNGLQPLDYPVDARGEGAHVVGIDGGEHRDPQLIAAEFAVRLGVDDAVGP